MANVAHFQRAINDFVKRRDSFASLIPPYAILLVAFGDEVEIIYRVRLGFNIETLKQRGKLSKLDSGLSKRISGRRNYVSEYENSPADDENYLADVQTCVRTCKSV